MKLTKSTFRNFCGYAHNGRHLARKPLHCHAKKTARRAAGKPATEFANDAHAGAFENRKARQTGLFSQASARSRIFDAATVRRRGGHGDRLAGQRFVEQRAADEVQRFRQRFPEESTERMEARVIRAAGRVYFEGYRLEDEDAEKASDLMETAEHICKIFGRDPQCFKTLQKGK